MKQLIIDIILTALIALYMTNNFHISFKPLKFEIEHFNWGYSLGLFLVLVGFFLYVGHARHLGKNDSGYRNGYTDACKDVTELIDKKYNKN